MATATAAATNLTLWGVLSESKRIINAHSRHFLALSVIFLLPLSFSLITSPLLFPHHILLQSLHTPQPPLSSLPLLLFFLFLLFLSFSSLSSITHSILNGFFGRPVKLPSALLSIFPNFFPLLVTSCLSCLMHLSLVLPALFLTVKVSNNVLILPVILLLILAILYLRVTWTLASVIAVAESTWGIQPLRRSAALTANMKPLAASCFLFFASLQAILLWTTSALVVDGWAQRDWAFVVQTVLSSTLLMLLMLYAAAADTVLYMYCKAVHGELALEIAEEFAWQYFSLPFDDGKVPHVVSVVRV